MTYSIVARDGSTGQFGIGIPGANFESPPKEYDYVPGYYAVFFHDPDGIKLELVHVPDDSLDSTSPTVVE
jgi:hypothetical protein